MCKGPYTKELVKAWKKWDKTHGSENDPVDELPADQLFLVRPAVVLGHSGV